jgi:hypothetical protein
MDDNAGGTRRPVRPPIKPTQSEKPRRDFAAAITKAEFGRFYWSSEQERALRTATAKRPKPTK